MIASAALRHPSPNPPRPPALAALDLGTNNCRLLVARARGQTFDIVDSFSRIVRLGEGVAQSGRLSERAMARTLAALKVCARIMARHRVERSRCVTTEACRRAANGEEFLARVERVTGLRLEVLASEQEAHLALLGCLPLLDPRAEHVLLVDIGGGSTEVLWLDRSRGGAGAVRCAVSMATGVVALAEAFTADPDEATFETMVRHVQDLLAPLDRAHQIGSGIAGPRVQMVGTSGTVTTLAAIHLDLRRYDRRRIDGLVLDAGAVFDISAHLRRMDGRARLAHPCIGAGRADLVVAGCAILEAILRRWPAQTLSVADRGLREGILHTLMGRSLETTLASTIGVVALCRPQDVTAADFGRRRD